ncbi:hypothetical protein [Pseudoalteromonas mariniglutinosa]|uniref:hypothetical protein n=1 Tax=Pseudoalteromonas mariniglutinosa TaxID=206042 RepID=UPI00384C3106
MTTWRTAIILSVLIHGLLLLFFATLKAPEIKQPPSPPIKAYMVSVSAKIKATQQTPQYSVGNPPQIVKKPPQLTNQAQPKLVNPFVKQVKNADVSVNPTSTISAENTDKKAATPYKKINLKKGLNSILKQQMGALLANSPANEYNTVSRITVPKSHTEKIKPQLQIEQQTMQVSTYRNGDRCFKKVSIGVGVMPQTDLPDSFLTAAKECDKTKLTQAYDAAMSKWLDKK